MFTGCVTVSQANFRTCFFSGGSLVPAFTALRPLPSPKPTVGLSLSFASPGHMMCTGSRRVVFRDRLPARKPSTLRPWSRVRCFRSPEPQLVCQLMGHLGRSSVTDAVAAAAAASCAQSSRGPAHFPAYVCLCCPGPRDCGLLRSRQTAPQCPRCFLSSSSDRGPASQRHRRFPGRSDAGRPRACEGRRLIRASLMRTGAELLMASCPAVSLLWGSVRSDPLSMFKVVCRPLLWSCELFIRSGCEPLVRYELQTPPVLLVDFLLSG